MCPGETCSGELTCVQVRRVQASLPVCPGETCSGELTCVQVRRVQVSLPVSR